MSIQLMNNSEDGITILNHKAQIITIKLKDEIKIIDDGGCVITTKPKHEMTVNLSTSCNITVAVAKLLGWIKGPRFPRVMLAMPTNGDDVYVDLLRILDEDESSLQAMLSHMRNVTYQELAAAADAGATHEELKETEEAVANIDSLIQNAFMYTSDIDEELAKGESSTLKIDQKTSEKTGVTHITLKSVDRWAKKEYGISILDDQEQHLSPEDAEAHPINQNIEEGPYTENRLTEITEKNLYTTFGFLIEAFAQTATRFGKDKGKPNIKQISDHIADLAAKASGTDEMDNQSAETIRKRLTKARNIKNSHFQPR